MRADFDSEADALSIDLNVAGRWDGNVEIDDTYCRVATSGGVPVNVELLNPADHLDLLEMAAEVTGVEARALKAAATSAITVPDTVVTLEFSPVRD